MDLHHLASGDRDQIRSPFVRRYDTLRKLEYVVESQEMVDWMVKLEIYNLSCGSFPQLLSSIKDAVVDDETEADVVCSTVHKAKGLGWPSVLLLDDFLLASHDSSRVPEQEVNICYSAMSRVSAGTLHLLFDPIRGAQPRRLASHAYDSADEPVDEDCHGCYGDHQEVDIDEAEEGEDEEEEGDDDFEECFSEVDAGVEEDDEGDGEQVEDLPLRFKLQDPFYKVFVRRTVENEVSTGRVEDIELGKTSRERFYRVRYDDGDLQHLTQEEVAGCVSSPRRRGPARSRSSTGEGKYDDADEPPHKQRRRG